MNKDIIVKIALTLDFPDILSLCRINKRYNRFICDNDDFWISKLRQDYGIEFRYIINFRSRKPKEYYKWAKTQEQNSDVALLVVVRAKDVSLTDLTIKLGATNFNQAMEIAAKNNNIEIIDILKLAGATNIDDIMIDAAEEGNMEIVNRMLDAGGEEIYLVADFAARQGDINMVNKMVRIGNETVFPLDYDELMAVAAGSGQKRIVELMIELGATDYNRAMGEAAENGAMDIISLLINSGGNDFALVIDVAESYGHDYIANEIRNKYM